MNKLYTAQEVADRLKIRKTTVYELIKRGELASSKIGKQLRVSEEQLAQYLMGSEPAPLPVQPSAFPPESSLLKRDYLLHSNGILLCGQNTPALDYLLGKIAAQSGALPILHSHMNSYNSLYALYFKKAHIAAASLKPEDITCLIPGERLILLRLYDYPLGFYIQKENPLNIRTLSDLPEKNVRFQNRERGSSRRIWFDRHLKASGISAASINGYTSEAISDMASAAAVASGSVDAALGEAFISRYYPNTEFLPLDMQTMYLVFPAEIMNNSAYSILLNLVCSREFREELHSFSGYDVTHVGELSEI